MYQKFPFDGNMYAIYFDVSLAAILITRVNKPYDRFHFVITMAYMLGSCYFDAKVSL